MKNIVSLIFMFTAISLSAASPAQKLIKRLAKVEKMGAFAFGHHDDTAYGHSWVNEEGRSDVKEVCGDYPAVMNWDLGMIECNDSANLDKVSFDKISCEVAKQDARGGINSFSWHLRNPATNGDSWDCSDKSAVAKAVTSGTQENDTLRAWIGRAARFINSLKDSNGKKLAVIFRPWHEHTGKWFWWGAPYCTPDEYKALWYITREIFDKYGVNNVVWAYSTDRVENEAAYLERCPQDKYIDIMGCDVYHFNGEKGLMEYTKSLNTTLSVAAKVAKDKGKLLALTETGSEGLKIPDWWMKTLYPIVSKFPITYLVVWRNAHDNPAHFYAPFKGYTPLSSFIEFYNNSKTLFCKDLNKIK